jgi:hypothetical protein
MTAAPESVPSRLGALRQVPYMGVIAVIAEAARLGYSNGDPDWCNLGQGQPEPGEMAGAPARLSTVTLDPTDHAYGPLEGLPELRERVAAIYNDTFRRGLASQYTAANVAVASGGRLALTRAMAALDAVQIGYQVPDYTAYEDMFNLHLERLSPVPLRGREEDGFAVTPARVRAATEEQGLGAYIFSNPCNPTGCCLRGAALAELTALARSHDLTLLSDEFYSHYVYEPNADGSARPGAGPVSAAEFVEDVEQDPVLLFDGLTKNHRYPGWRVGWVVGPAVKVEAIARTASSIDGGPSRVALEALYRFAVWSEESDFIFAK